MPYNVEIKEREARPAVVVRFTAHVSEMGEYLGKAFSAVQEHVNGSGIEVAGPPFAYTEPLGDNRYAVRAGFPVQTPVAGGGEVEAFELPAGTVATTLHVGSYSRLSDAFAAIEEYARAEGYNLDTKAPSWEEYLTGPETPPEQTQTMVCWPLQPK